jgi:hypothetical protein
MLACTIQKLSTGCLMVFEFNFNCLGTYRVFDMETNSYTFRFRVNKSDGTCHAFEYLSGTSEIDDELIEGQEDFGALPPMTLAINGHILITNGHTSGTYINCF